MVRVVQVRMEVASEGGQEADKRKNKGKTMEGYLQLVANVNAGIFDFGAIQHICSEHKEHVSLGLS